MHEGAASRRYYLGVDGGQSSTTALIADETGQVLGVGSGGPCNHVTGQEAKAKFAVVVGDCLAHASHAAGFASTGITFAGACLGFSGGAEDKESSVRELVRSVRLKLTNDAEIALTGATEGEPGIVIIAGTGSMALGRNAAGRTARAGGWGHLFGDEGAGFDIVRRALRAALQYEEGWGPATSLRELLLQHTHLVSANQLLHHLYSKRNGEIAAFAPLVTEAAESGDLIASNILKDAAMALKWYVEGVFHALFVASDEVIVAHIGGAFQSTLLRHFFAEKLQNAIARAPVFPKFSPAVGALIEALRIDGNFSAISGIPKIKS